METDVPPGIGTRTLAARLKDSAAAARAFAFYRRHSRIAPAVFFLSGVVWDAATVYRIDSIVDNTLVVLYLLLYGSLVVLSSLASAGKLTTPRLLRYQPWFAAASQFLLGALFSVFVFFYSQSASLSGTSVYLVALVLLLVANEFLRERIVSIHLGLALYYVALASFLVYFVPMVTRSMSAEMFVAGTAGALLVAVAMAEFLRRRKAFARTRQFVTVVALLLTLFGLHQLAYVRNWIPPVPVALRDAGIYREVVREGDTYQMRFADRPWWQFWKNDERDFAWRPGDAVYCYTAVFAPTRLASRIIHVWQHRDGPDGRWETTDRIGYDILGGRDHGYRGYTFKEVIRPGHWRVRVEMGDGRLLSRVDFEVAESNEQPKRFRWVSSR